MAPKFHLYYFKVAGRGEVCRHVFMMAGVEFEYTHWPPPHESNYWFTDCKSKAPFGQLPYLEIDEGDGSEKVVLCQSHNIARYLARRFGLNGDSLIEQAKVEMLADCANDYMEVPCRAIHGEKDQKKKEEKIKQVEKDLPATYANFERHLMMNNNGDGFFVGDDITWCDVYIAYRVLWVIHREKRNAPIDNFPKLKAFVERVQAHPSCRDWFKDYHFLPKSQ